MTDWLIRGGFRVTAAFQKTNLLQILRKLVGMIYSVVWTTIQFRVCKYERYATGPYSIELQVTPLYPTIETPMDKI